MIPLSNQSTSPIAYGSVQDAVVDRIRELILSGQFKPGAWLRQDELAQTLGVSTMPIREALRKLQAEGLVVFHPRRGAMVATITVADYEEIYRIREEMEILAVRWAAENFDHFPLAHLKQLLAEIEDAAVNQDIPRRMQTVREFFFLIFAASQKSQLIRILSGLWDLSQQYRRYFSTFPEIVPQRLANYRQVYHACEMHDVDALVQAIRDIYAFGKTNLIPRLREQETHEQTK
ncbi:MAG: GntR family transcriptional regulator [Chloroflexi bacterium]|nr:GntR family transcriptional regulator [Chloroflexota bacterium]